MNYLSREQGCKSQAWQIGLGWAVSARIFKWTGPSRSGPKFLRVGPFFAKYHFFERRPNLKWVNNRIQIFFKTSSKIRREIKLGLTGPRFQLGRVVTVKDFNWTGSLRPKISAGLDWPEELQPWLRIYLNRKLAKDQCNNNLIKFNNIILSGYRILILLRLISSKNGHLSLTLEKLKVLKYLIIWSSLLIHCILSNMWKIGKWPRDNFFKANIFLSS